MSSIYTVDGSSIDLGGGSEATARIALTGKVWIAIGDSYTANWKDGMGQTHLPALANKYGAVLDNRGVGSATISWRENDSNRRMPNIVDTVVSNYTNGKTISEHTYYASDVALITFMGGTNDDAGWIGKDIHDTDKNLDIYGALNYIFSNLLKTFTSAKIICITQPPAYAGLISGVATDARAQELGFTNMAALQNLTDVEFCNILHTSKENAVRDAAILYGIPMADVCYEFPTMLSAENRSTYWLSDKLHLTSAGYDIIASAIDKKIVNLFGQ